ncbi:unnamed protein product [Adineta steineri]|uniref:DED domain-containing protein n=1 Tax=Adineta steineri TaxID=433720 RepID=A0A815LZS1_9BILA|nr:unnamed protein product [Adineta steineri]CAF1619770.1 unnamed protein product [Adineta steineri]
MDCHHLRALILKIQDYLSDDDRKRLHFFFGNDIPRRIRDDPSLGGTLNLMESLFDQDKISEQDFTFLINAFDEINCLNAVHILREHMRKMQTNGQHQSTQTLATILLQDPDETDKYAHPNCE